MHSGEQRAQVTTLRFASTNAGNIGMLQVIAVILCREPKSVRH